MSKASAAARGSLLDMLFDEPGPARCLVAHDGKVLRANGEWLRSTGLKPGDLIGAEWTTLFPEAREAMLAAKARAPAEERTVKLRLRQAPHEKAIEAPSPRSSSTTDPAFSSPCRRR